MPLSVTCGECNKTFRIKDELAGKRVLCPNCSERVQVPAAEEEDEPDEVAEDQPESEEEESKPKRKKKRKKKSRGSGFPWVVMPDLPDLGISYRMLLFLFLALVSSGIAIYLSFTMIPDMLRTTPRDPQEAARYHIRNELVAGNESFKEVRWFGPYESKPNGARQQFANFDGAGNVETAVDTADGGAYAIRVQFETERPYRKSDSRLGQFMVSDKLADVTFIIGKRDGTVVLLRNQEANAWEKLIDEKNWVLVTEKPK